MLTTGFKLWFGFFVGAVLAAVFAGYTSGATETGPLSLGWKGGVGNHVSYTILATGAGVLALLGLVAVAFRDADAEAQADFLGLDEAPPAQAVVGNSLWPVFGALGLGSVGVGLVVHPAIFVIGLCLLGAVAVEWTMTNWSEKVSDDASVNADARENLMRPIEIPVLGAAGVGNPRGGCVTDIADLVGQWCCRRSDRDWPGYFRLGLVDQQAARVAPKHSARCSVRGLSGRPCVRHRRRGEW